MTTAAETARLQGLIVAAVLGGALGCGQASPRLVIVEGTVVCDGELVPTGAVVFAPDSDPSLGEGRSAIDERGRFSIRHDRHPHVVGVPPGRYRVGIFASRALGGDPLATEYELLVPGRYANPETSGLVVDVTDGQDRIDLDFDLTAAADRPR